MYVNKAGAVVLYINDLYSLKKDTEKSDYAPLMFPTKAHVSHCHDLNYGCPRIT